MEPPAIKRESSARNRSNALWLRRQIADLKENLGELAHVERLEAMESILAGVAWRKGQG